MFINWDHEIFVYESIHEVNYTYWFMHGASPLHPWNNSTWSHYDTLDVFFNLVCKYFIDNFCICISGRLASNSLCLSVFSPLCGCLSQIVFILFWYWDSINSIKRVWRCSFSEFGLIWVILVLVQFCADEKNVHSLVFGWNVLFMSIRSIWSMDAI